VEGLVGVEAEADANLPEVAGALDGAGGLAGLAERGQEDRDQQRDDADDDEKLDERERGTRDAALAAHEFLLGCGIPTNSPCRTIGERGDTEGGAEFTTSGL